MAKAEYRSAVRSRKLIQRALADLLQEKPLDKITVTDVVNRAEINRGTFYAHYRDIPDVLDHLMRQSFAKIEEGLSQGGAPEEMPRIALHLIQEILEADLEFSKKVMTSSAAPRMMERIVETVQDFLLQREEAFGVTDHEQYVLAIHFGGGGLSALYRDWFAGKLDFSLDELTRRAEVMLGSVLADLR